MPRQNGRQQRRLPSPHVHDASEALEVVGLEDSGSGDTGERCHGGVKDGIRLGIMRSILPHAHTVDVLEARCPCLHTVEEMRPRLLVIELADVDGPGAGGFGGIGSQTVAERGQGEPTIRVLSEDAHAGECSKQPVQRAGLGPGCRSEVIAAPRAILQ